MLTSGHKLRYGILEPPPSRYALQAGPLSLELQGGIFRHVRCGESQVLQSVYAAVRDTEWGTVPGVISHLSVDAYKDRFAVRFRSTHRQGSLHFVWQTEAVGNADGRIQWTFQGSALAEFVANRIGVCVLHPSAFGGRPCQVLHTDGSSDQQSFPESIAPAPIFQSVRALSYPIAGSLEACIALEGDVFETEDQRNWCDGTYKTYSRPLHLPLPQRFPQDATVSQSVKLDLRGSVAHSPTPATPTPVRLSLQMDRRSPWPSLGCALDSSSRISPQAIERLRALGLKFLLVDAADLVLVDALRVARELRVPLDVVLQPDVDLGHVEALGTEAGSCLRRFLVAGTSADALSFAAQLAHRFAVPVAVGSAWNYAGLNRGRPRTVPTGGLWFALQPQEHGSDESTLIENLAAQGSAVRDASHWSGGHAVTATVRFRAQLETQQGSAEANCDPRQHSLFGAAWTVGSLKHLAEAGATNVSTFSASGVSGLVLDRAAASPNALFEAMKQDVVSPAYHVLRALADSSNAVCISTLSSEPLAVEALALRSATAIRMLVANYTDRLQQVALLAPDLPVEGSVRVLDEASVKLAVQAPEEYARQPAKRIQAQGGSFHLALEPCATQMMHWTLTETRGPSRGDLSR